MSNRINDIERTAYHEAGHAVAAYIYKRRFVKISVIPDRESLGRVVYHKNYWQGFVPDEFQSKTLRRIEDEILKIFAGEVAEGIYTRRQTWKGAKEHLRRAKELAAFVCGSQEEVSAFVEWLWKREINLMNDPLYRSAVQRLANALLAEKELNYRRARQIIRTALQENQKVKIHPIRQGSREAASTARLQV